MVNNYNGYKTEWKYSPYDRPWSPTGVVNYSSTLSWTSALDVVCGQGHAPAVLTCEVESAQLHKSLCGLQIQSALVPNISPQRDSNLWPSTLQQVASWLHYPYPQNLEILKETNEVCIT